MPRAKELVTFEHQSGVKQQRKKQQQKQEAAKEAANDEQCKGHHRKQQKRNRNVHRPAKHLHWDAFRQDLGKPKHHSRRFHFHFIERLTSLRKARFYPTTLVTNSALIKHASTFRAALNFLFWRSCRCREWYLRLFRLIGFGNSRFFFKSRRGLGTRPRFLPRRRFGSPLWNGNFTVSLTLWTGNQKPSVFRGRTHFLPADSVLPSLFIETGIVATSKLNQHCFGSRGRSEVMG